MQWKDYGNLGEIIKTGCMKQGPYSPDIKDDSFVRAYIWGMDNMGKERARRIAEILDLSSATKLLDVGGGAATYSIAFAKKNPQLTSVVLDLPATLAIARENIEQNGFSGRISTQACSYWEMDYKLDFDVVWISQIIHSLGEEQVAELIQRAEAAVAPGGRLIIHDGFLGMDLASPYHAALFSVYMLAVTEQGRCYSTNEVMAWMMAAGLSKVHCVALDLESEMLVGIKP
jgi:cyclopropane fatty-acyl-phospholipid synthase-like methyltransferase